MDSSIVRATLLLAAGIFVGVVIGVTISPARRTASTVVQAGDGGSAATANLKAKSGSRLESEMEHPNILLGEYCDGSVSGIIRRSFRAIAAAAE